MLFTLVCLLAVSSAHAIEMSRKDLMPENLDIVVHCSNLDDLIESVQKSPLGKLVISEKMKPFWNGQDLNSLVNGFFLRNKGSLRPDDQKKQRLVIEELKMLKGEVVAGINLSTEENFFIAAAMSKENFNKSLVMDKEMAQLDPLEYYFKKEKFQGIDLHTMITKEDGRETKAFQGFYRGTLIASNSREWVERSIVRLKKLPVTDPSGNPVVSISVMPQVVDKVLEKIKTLKKDLPADAPEENRPDMDFSQVLTALGIKHFQGMNFTAEMKKDRSEFHLDISNNGGPTGIWSIFSQKTVSTGYRLPYVPSDYASYSLLSLDINRFWNQVPEIINRISPEMTLKYHTMIGTFNAMLAVDLNRDIFANLSNKVFTCSSIPDTGQQVLYGFEVTDAAAMEQTIAVLFSENSRLRAMLADHYDTIDIKGHTIHLLRFTSDPSSSHDLMDTAIAVTVAGTALVIGNESLVTPFVQAGINKKGVDQFYKTETYKAYTSLIPENTCGFGFGKLSRNVRFLVNKLKSPGFLEMINSSDRENPDRADSFLKNLRFDKLPSAEFISSFFGDTVAFTQNNGSLIQSTTYIIYPQ